LPRYSVAGPAKSDLKEIARYTFENWGETQMRKYNQALHECFGMLAEHPDVGQLCERLAPGIRRLRHEKHVVFYRRKRGGIRVIRVLHERQLPARELFG
jgi:toxin ParE1/3/4